ncbi:6-phosphogluconate dehydrogenase, partial [Cyathus striatus]
SMTTITIVAPGAMGSAVGRKLVEGGCIVFTNLEGRSAASRKRAAEAGMVDMPWEKIIERSDLILSIVPPKDALSFALKFADLFKSLRNTPRQHLTFADCNAVSPSSVLDIAAAFEELPISFIDACIIGGPPTIDYNPTFYASTSPKHSAALEQLENLTNNGLIVKALRSEGADVGDASALKMSYAGISKGLTGLLTTMLLASHASSPATSQALLSELKLSQPELLRRITRAISPMFPKAYRWVGEMNEIADFIGKEEGDIYRGMAKIYERINGSLESDKADVTTLQELVDAAKTMLEPKK